MGAPEIFVREVDKPKKKAYGENNPPHEEKYPHTEKGPHMEKKSHEERKVLYIEIFFPMRVDRLLLPLLPANTHGTNHKQFYCSIIYVS